MTPAWSLVWRRGLHQRLLLLAVLAVVVAGAVLLGTCALLLTEGQDDALRSSLARTPDADVDVQTSVRVTGGDPGDVVDAVQDAGAAALGGLDAEVSTWLTSGVLYLQPGVAGAPVDGPAVTYLASVDDLDRGASLVDGRWPAARADGPVEAALPASAATLLGLTPGSTIVLSADQHGADLLTSGDDGPVTVEIVGTFTPLLDDGAWERDVLAGAGHDPAWERPGGLGRVPVPAYGPLVVLPAPLLDGTVTLDRVSVNAHPFLDALDPRSVEDRLQTLDAAEPTLRALLGDDATDVQVRTDLPETLRTALVRRQVTGAIVLVVAVVGTALAAAALALAGLLVTGRRSTETELLAARGAARSQLAGQSLAESLAVALLGATIAVPLTLVVYRWIAHAPVLVAAGLRPPTTVTPALVLSVGAGALALVAVLVLPSLRRPGHARVRAARAGGTGVVARSGADLALLALAVIGFLQLRAHPVALGRGPDAVLVAAPVLCLLAGAALALRILPLVARAGERRAAGSRGLLAPLAVWEVSRRRQSTGTAFLLVLATAAATFGVALADTWSSSQQDQGDVIVGSDLSVTAHGPSMLLQAAALADATGGQVSPVGDRPVTLGALTGSAPALQGAGPRLVAVDTLHAQDALRGRLPSGSSWSSLTTDLAPTTATAGIRVAGAGPRLAVTITATAPDGPLSQVVPTLVVESPGGHREALQGAGVPLDGQPHEVELALPPPRTGAPDLVVVAIGLHVLVQAQDDLPPDAVTRTPMSVAVTLPGTIESADSRAIERSWSVGSTPTSAEQSTPVTVRVAQDGAATTVLADAVLQLTNAAGHVDLALDAFASPADVPVVITQALADEIAAVPGGALSLDLGTRALQARVVRTVPYVPSIPRGPAVLVDYDALSRGLLAQGDYTTLTDRWTITGTGDPEGAAALVVAADLGEPTTSAAVGADLRDGPSQVLLPVALRVLVLTALLLALVGTAVHTAATLETRGVEVARLQGVGVPRGTVAGAIVLERGIVSLLSVGAGAAVGWVVSATVGPLLVLSERALAPVPPVVPRWPWPEQTLLLAGLVLGCAAVVVPVALTLLRRATSAHLRMDSAS